MILFLFLVKLLLRLERRDLLLSLSEIKIVHLLSNCIKLLFIIGTEVLKFFELLLFKVIELVLKIFVNFLELLDLVTNVNGHFCLKLNIF